MRRSYQPKYFPDLDLPSTKGKTVNVRRLIGSSVVFVYPYTGRPGYGDPPGWDDIKGAHGSTPQALAYKALHEQFKALRVSVFGLSFQDAEWQQEFATRNQLPFALLSDANAEVACRAKWPTFSAGQRTFLKRRTVIIENGQISYDQENIPSPESDAADVLGWFK
jgi:peroxiredoxin